MLAVPRREPTTTAWTYAGGVVAGAAADMSTVQPLAGHANIQTTP
jgi:hypothetical protein